MDLYVDLPIPFSTAALGGTVKVPGLDNTFDYVIPEGTQSGTTFTVRGKGIKSRSGTGNLYIRVTVEVPTRLTREQKRKIAETASALDIRQYDKAKRYADLLQTVKNHNFRDRERDELLEIFDSTFIGLFPTFVDEFNMLLRPDCLVPERKIPGHRATFCRGEILHGMETE